MAAPSVKGFTDFQRFKILAKDELTSLLDQVSLPNNSGDRWNRARGFPSNVYRENFWYEKWMNEIFCYYKIISDDKFVFTIVEKR